MRKSIRRFHALRFDDTIIVGLSGGVCSSALLYLLKNFSSKRSQSRLLGVSVDLSGKTLDCVSSLCGDLGVEHHGVDSHGEGFMGALCIAGKDLGASKVAVGFCLDDVVHDGLSAFLEGEFGVLWGKGDSAIITPLRDSPIEEVELYARIKKIPYVRRAVDKDDVVGIIENLEGKHPGARFQILSSVESLRGLGL